MSQIKTESTSPYIHRGTELPEHLRESIDAYVQHGRPVGDFLKAVIENDLARAVAMADEEGLHKLVAIVGYLYNRCPASCWGGPIIYRTWIVAHGCMVWPV